MKTQILDGKAIALKTEAELFQRVANIKDVHGGKIPMLATILVGGDPASATYVRMKQNACKRIGMDSIAVEMPEDTTTEELLEKIQSLNSDPSCQGILLQHPVPSQIDERSCFDSIDPTKDVDGVTCLGFGRISMGERAYGSATPQGIMRLLSAYEIDIEGKHAVI
ncbi:bifunctional 5,10-methylene-tetrahydrofolate dehydrogenase/5,10-methylene-tetrahydrofolate cyclohydrolase, partial [bacterium]|nr:bifunctional 5,10-methylene-tetrahydrofolate dehydrogenase/5,10-methylene-tetrahydrofolate cyclohydrolase [bacterium]